MRYLERFLRYIFWVAVTAAAAWFVKKLFVSVARKSASAAAPRPGSAMLKPKTLFRDPVCGTYVAEEVSQRLASGEDNQNLHFCSRECMEHYRREHRANVAESGSVREGGRVAAGA